MSVLLDYYELFGSPDATRDHIAEAERHLVMLRSLREEVWSNSWTLTPPPSGAWRSSAADRYAERLEELRAHLISSRDSIDWAESNLEFCIDGLRVRLSEQIARAAE